MRLDFLKTTKKQINVQILNGIMNIIQLKNKAF